MCKQSLIRSFGLNLESKNPETPNLNLISKAIILDLGNNNQFHSLVFISFYYTIRDSSLRQPENIEWDCSIVPPRIVNPVTGLGVRGDGRM
ncbi:hypothetical protein HNY73_010620 [Argiope bruennichi]|uniref:Uncharacterized protein n=1 Tax=Argiope bruennichi TaxID=94029 RepID=A0A8T0F7Q1_ARGBR|nr:hypothetical protein HNY73_010620 [Argiope bruennichi]